MTHFVTKAPPINSIDRKCRTKKLKSSGTCLIGYSGFISREWFLIAWGVDTHTHAHEHTPHTHTHILISQIKSLSRFQETRHVPGLKIHLAT